MMLVNRILPAARERLVTVGDDAPLTEAAKLLSSRRTGLVVVCKANGALAGVVTRTDVVGQIGHCRGSACTTPVAAIMSVNVTACRPGEWLQDVWARMKTRNLQHLPMIDETSIPLGVVYAQDALQALLEEVEEEEILLRDYVMCVGYH